MTSKLSGLDKTFIEIITFNDGFVMGIGLWILLLIALCIVSTMLFCFIAGLFYQ